MTESQTSPDGIARKLLAIGLGALAAKLAIVAVEQLWTRGLRQEVPSEEDESLLRKAAWIGLTAAAVGLARELARQVAAPRLKEEA